MAQDAFLHLDVIKLGSSFRLMTGVLCHIFVDLDDSDISLSLVVWKLWSSNGYFHSLVSLSSIILDVVFVITLVFQSASVLLLHFFVIFPVLRSLYCLSILDCCVLHIHLFFLFECQLL